MSSHEYLVQLDPEDLTPKQMMRIIRRLAMMRSSRKDQADKDEETDKAVKENSDVVDLQEEKKGKSKAPPVKEDDLPEGIAQSEEEKKPSKKAKA